MKVAIDSERLFSGGRPAETGNHYFSGFGLGESTDGLEINIRYKTNSINLY